MPQLNATYLETFSTPIENYTALHKQATQISDEVIKELFDVDIIIINIAMWNFSIPSSLKAWIDQIARAGITFGFSERSPFELITGKKVFIAIASGGIYSEAPYHTSDFITPYLKFILFFLGLTDVTTLRVEGLAIQETQSTTFEKALKSIDELEIPA